jgi:hypothetical protein
MDVVFSRLERSVLDRRGLLRGRQLAAAGA